MPFIGNKPTAVPLSGADIQDGTIGLADLSATGTKDATTFLRGDNTFATAGGTNTPSFQAKLSSNQVISAETLTKVAVNSELFDSDGCYNNTGSTTTLNGISVPSYSFAPNVSGKYFIFGSISLNPSGSDNIYRVIMKFAKNDTHISNSDNTLNSSTFASGFTIYQGVVVDLNGTSDYVDMQAFLHPQGTPEIRIIGDTQESRTWFGAYKIIE